MEVVINNSSRSVIINLTLDLSGSESVSDLKKYCTTRRLENTTDIVS